MKSTKWLIIIGGFAALVIALVGFLGGMAAPNTQTIDPYVYLPIVLKQELPTPTPTFMPTVTPTPSVTPIPPPTLPPPRSHNGGDIVSLAFSPAYPNDATLFVGSWQGFFMTINGGSSWDQIDTVVSRDIAVSPSYASDHTLFQAAGAFVYKTTNWGQSWYGTAPCFPYAVHSLAISPQYVTDQTIFAGTWAGVAKSTNSGATWERFTNSPTMVRFLALTTNYPNDLTL